MTYNTILEFYLKTNEAVIMFSLNVKPDPDNQNSGIGSLHTIDHSSVMKVREVFGYGDTALTRYESFYNNKVKLNCSEECKKNVIPVKYPDTDSRYKDIIFSFRDSNDTMEWLFK